MRRAGAWFLAFAVFLCVSHSLANDYYKILDVPRDASPKEIKKAYRKKALEMHPDKLGPNVTEAQEQAFINVVLAYETLSDEASRKRYDAFGPEDGPGGSRGPAVVVKTYNKFPFDMYVRMPGGAFEFHWKPKQRPRAPDMTIPISITLLEVLTGTTKTINVTRQRWCTVCGGTGAASHEHSHTCEVCGGSGTHLYLQECTSGYKHAINKTCEYCQGTGTQPSETCPHCGGARMAPETSAINVTLNPGVAHGARIRMAGGRQAIGHQDGSVVVLINVETHPKFKVTSEGHLMYESRISLIDALLGFTRKLTLLDGEKLEVTHDVVTFSGYEQRFEGYGLPTPKNPAQRTDLIIKFTVVFPRRLTDAQREVLREVMNEEEIAILESVIKLATARDAELAGAAMSDEELRYSRQCSEDPFICVPDVATEVAWRASLPSASAKYWRQRRKKQRTSGSDAGSSAEA